MGRYPRLCLIDQGLGVRRDPPVPPGLDVGDGEPEPLRTEDDSVVRPAGQEGVNGLP